MDNEGQWGLAQIWNKSIEQPEDREYIPRDYIYASELGKSYLDVYLKMKGVQPSNVPNSRSLRKFEAGNLWEWFVKIILLRADIMIETQKRVRTSYKGMVDVSGKVDFIAGGKPNFDKAKAEIENLCLPEKTSQAMSQISEYLKENYPDGLDKKVLEIKSVSSYMMNTMEITKQPLEIHALQAYHYTKDEEISRADVIYICRDDCRMMEFPLLANSEKWEKKYTNYLKTISNYYEKDQEPPKGEPVIFDEVQGKFSLNRLVGWSPYLTLMYGMKDQMEFDEKYGKIPAGWNRVLKRLAEGKEPTKNNLEKMEEMEKEGWKPTELAKKFIINNEEEENGDNT